MPASKHIVVIGSANMDLVCRTPRIPRAGETILGEKLLTIPGGKGANQAVAAARLAGPDVQVHFVGRVGSDDFGQRLVTSLSQYQVHIEHVTVTEGVASGCAMILVDGKGENAIVVAPGANAKLSPADIDRAEQVIARAEVVVLQLEIPPETAAHAVAVCRRHGVFTILDPAPVPAGGLPRDLMAVDLLTPNQGEAELLLGKPRTHHVTTSRLEDPKQIGGELLARGAKTVVLKLGGSGAVIVGQGGYIERLKPHKVNVVDTTAAGDAFTGGLAVAHAEGMSLLDAARFANAAGAACCNQFGAQPALPTRDAILELLKQTEAA